MILILIIILILIFTFIILRITFASNEIAKGNIDIEDLKTGDILFVEYNNSLGNLMRVWSGSKWTHIAMIYEDRNGDKYVMETANYPRPLYKDSYIKHKGVLFLTLNNWLKYNHKRNIAVLKLNTPEDFDTAIFLKRFEEVHNKQLDTFNIKWFRLLYKKSYVSKETTLNENITCYELIIYILQESGVAKKIYTPDSYFPNDLIENKIILNKGFYFDKLKKLNF
jgi:hypothetical protein